MKTRKANTGAAEELDEFRHGEEGGEGDDADDVFDYTIVLSPNIEFQSDFVIDGGFHAVEVQSRHLNGFPIVVKEIQVAGDRGEGRTPEIV